MRVAPLCILVVALLALLLPARASSPVGHAGAVERELLTSNRTYVVRGSDGDDSRDCLTEALACRTWQGALDKLNMVDFGNRSVTIRHGAEGAFTFADPVRVPPTVGGGVLRLQGHAAPGETVLNVAGDAILVDRATANVSVRDLTIRGGGSGIVIMNGAIASIENGVIFGPVGFAHVFVHDRPSVLYALGSRYAVAGSADYHVYVSAGFAYLEHGAVALTGAPTWRGAFLGTGNGGGAQVTGMTFAGASSGQRYSVDTGTIQSGGCGPVCLPGSNPGTETNGGRYL